VSERFRATRGAILDGSERLSSPGSPVSVSADEGYQRWAPTYDLTLNPLLSLEERYVTPLLPSMMGKAVLDVACGTGRWLEKLVALGAQPGVGIDLSAAMLRIAATKIPIAGRLVRANCAQFPFAAASFDFAICSLALSHVRDLSAVSRELAMTLKPGADLFVSDLHPEADARGWRTGFRDGTTAFRIKTIPHSVAEILESFRPAGFDCCDLRAARLGKPEEPIFIHAHKEHLFQSACEVPALLICRFRRNRLNWNDGHVGAGAERQS
jgi:ubiquinone/menaquinone biosynthesis C-methylase UbiE